MRVKSAPNLKLRRVEHRVDLHYRNWNRLALACPARLTPGLHGAQQGRQQLGERAGLGAAQRVRVRAVRGPARRPRRPAARRWEAYK